MSVAEKMTAIANAIRNKTGKTDKLSLDEMATEINEISTGERDINPEWTDWRYFSCYNNRNDLVAKLKYSDTSNGTDFSYMFDNCSSLTTIPEIDTSNGTNLSYMFRKCESLKSIPICNTNKNKDFKYIFSYCSALTTIPEIDTSNGKSFSSMFRDCLSLTTIPTLNTSKGVEHESMFNGCSALIAVPPLNTSNSSKVSYMFNGCSALTTISQIDFTKVVSSSYISNVFKNCNSLTDLNVIGTINTTGLNVQYSPLSHDSLMSIINALANKTGVSGTWKVTLGATNLAKLTADEIAIAEGKGWTLA